MIQLSSRELRFHIRQGIQRGTLEHIRIEDEVIVLTENGQETRVKRASTAIELYTKGPQFLGVSSS